MAKLFQQALSEAPRHKPTPVIPLTQDESILSWLESSGRLVPYKASGYEYQEEIADIAEVVDDIYELGTEEEEDVEI